MIEELLDRDGSLTYKNVGSSMRPLIKENRDVLTIVKRDPTVPLKKYDVVLYHKRGNHYTLHRILKIKKDGSLIINGDHNSWLEKDIKQEDILGILTTIERKDKKIDLATSKKYYWYCHTYIAIHPIRRFFLFCFALPRRTINHFKRKKHENKQ